MTTVHSAGPPLSEMLLRLNPRLIGVHACPSDPGTEHDLIEFEIEEHIPTLIPDVLREPVVSGGAQERRIRVRRDRLEQAQREEPHSFLADLACLLKLAGRQECHWHLARRTLRLSRRAPLLMGIVNVTPDSFSDGGRFARVEDAVAQGERLVEEGAAVLDIGGESSRPGSEQVPLDLEQERVLPVLESLRRKVDVPLSIDTTKAVVARAALQAGADIVNDTSALEDDPEMAEVVAGEAAGLILMHRRGRPHTMQEKPSYGHCVAEVAAFLRRQARRARDAGIVPERIVLDPGIGFGKRLQDNLALLRGLHQLRSLGFPMLLGTSRKSFLGTLTGRPVEERGAATLATTALAHAAGVELIRVHEVASSRDVLRVCSAVAGADD